MTDVTDPATEADFDRRIDSDDRLAERVRDDLEPFVSAVEREVAVGKCLGMSAAGVAAALGLPTDDVDAHWTNVLNTAERAGMLPRHVIAPDSPHLAPINAAFVRGVEVDTVLTMHALGRTDGRVVGGDPGPDNADDGSLEVGRGTAVYVGRVVGTAKPTAYVLAKVVPGCEGASLYYRVPSGDRVATLLREWFATDRLWITDADESWHVTGMFDLPPEVEDAFLAGETPPRLSLFNDSRVADPRDDPDAEVVMDFAGLEDVVGVPYIPMPPEVASLEDDDGVPSPDAVADATGCTRGERDSWRTFVKERTDPA